MKAVFGLWSEIKVHQINRVLRPFNVRLIIKRSRDWGDAISITAHPIMDAVRAAQLADLALDRQIEAEEIEHLRDVGPVDA